MYKSMTQIDELVMSVGQSLLHLTEFSSGEQECRQGSIGVVD